jgi:arsenite oxidase large subunit
VSETRRKFMGGLLGVGAAACATREEEPKPVYTEVIPPPTARLSTTACAYCIVGCGYRVYTWPTTEPMGTRADNALGRDLSEPGAPWIAPEMVSRVTIGGLDHHIAVLPDFEAEVVNLGGDYTQGGALARRFVRPGEPTERLLVPQLRIDGRLQPVSWDDAIELIARYSMEVLAQPDGPLRWGMKTYSYQFYENTFAITRLAFGSVQTPCWAPHDRSAEGSDAPGVSDAGIDVFSASYQDWYDADVIFVSGVSLNDAHGVLFSQWVQRGGATLIVVDPRREVVAEYAEATGGLHLQIVPGTDTALQRAIARVIVEEGWEDLDWIAEWTASEEDLALETSWRRMRFMTTYEAYRDDLLNDPDAELEAAAAICGVSADQIWRAAELLASPDESGVRPRASMMLEKGNYWGHPYGSTASFASLALLVGAGNRPGQVVSRAGGHQRGMVAAASYPTDASPDRFEDHAIPLDLDRWASEGNLEFLWVMGCTWAGGGTARAAELYEQVRELTGGSPLPASVQAEPGGPVDVDAVVAAWRARAAGGGMVLVQSDLYPQALTELADLVLPAAGWGEMTGTRMQGERRLRLYPKLVDAPGESRPDWEVVAEVGRRMGYSGFDWADQEALLEEVLGATSGVHAAGVLLEYAEAKGTTAMELIRSTGTRGLQCPLSLDEAGEIVQTVRHHDAELGRGFSTTSGRAIFMLSRWAEIQPVQERIAPRGDELWVINRRTSTNWSSLVEDRHIPLRREMAGDPRLEIHPDDAAARGIAEGDAVEIESPEGLTFEARASLVEGMAPGVTCAYFNFGGDPTTAANNAVSAEVDPLMNRYLVKLGRGSVRLSVNTER